VKCGSSILLEWTHGGRWGLRGRMPCIFVEGSGSCLGTVNTVSFVENRKQIRWG